MDAAGDEKIRRRSTRDDTSEDRSSSSSARNIDDDEDLQPPAKRPRIPSGSDVPSAPRHTAAEKERALSVSHMMSMIVFPTIQRYTEEALILPCAEALFPIRGPLLRKLGNETKDMYAVLEYANDKMLSRSFEWMLKNLRGRVETMKRKKPLVPMFVSACESGKLDTAKLLARISGIGISTVDANDNELLVDICKHDHQNIAEWLVDEFHLVSRSKVNCREILIPAVTRGSFELAKWIIEKFKLDEGPNRALMLEGFQAVCSHGNMEVVDWIASWCQLTTSEVRSNANAALRNACRNGHLDLVKWMIDRFALDASDARQAYMQFYHNNDDVVNKHPEIPEWFWYTFGL